MRTFVVGGLTVLAAAAGFAQTARGTLAGTVTLRDTAVPAVTVEVKNQLTNAVLTATTEKSGRYKLTDLPEGVYEVSIPPLGIAAGRFVQKDVAIKAGETTALDIALKQGNLATLGDDNGFFAIHNNSQGVRGPAPRTRDGHPDLSGVWNVNLDPHPTPASLLPWAEGVMKERRETNFRDQPSGFCLPDDPTPTLPLLRRFVYTPTMLVQLFEQEPHYRQIFLDGREHPRDADPTWMGHAVGRWEKDTLVVDTTGFNDKSWVLFAEGLPHTDKLHMIERYRRPDLGHLVVDLTLDDPATFAKPIERHMTWQLAPKDEVLESICTENNKYQQNAGIQ
jgi:carboxypeptidase family protein